jgi:hypothetical protein
VGRRSADLAGRTPQRVPSRKTQSLRGTGLPSEKAKIYTAPPTVPRLRPVPNSASSLTANCQQRPPRERTRPEDPTAKEKPPRERPVDSNFATRSQNAGLALCVCPGSSSPAADDYPAGVDEPDRVQEQHKRK